MGCKKSSPEYPEYKGKADPKINFDELEGVFSNDELQLANDCLIALFESNRLSLVKGGMVIDYHGAYIHNIIRLGDGSLTLRYEVYGERNILDYPTKAFVGDLETFPSCSPSWVTSTRKRINNM